MLVLILASGEERFLTLAADAVEEAADALAETEALRAMVAEGVAQQLGARGPEPTLSRIIAVAAGPARTTLEQLRSEMQELTADIAEVSTSGRELATVGADSVRRTLERLATGRPDLRYGDTGLSGGDVPPTRFDQRA